MMALPKKAWFAALEAIDDYRTKPSKANLVTLKVSLKEAEIYVPRDL